MHYRLRRCWMLGGFAALLMIGTPAETRADAAPAAATQLVVLVRHAEKSLDRSADPGLTAIGRARAKALQLALAQADVGAIISSQWQRTRATAAPLAKARGLAPIIVATGGDTAAHAQAVARTVRAQSAAVVLVVGHSNTVPAIIKALGGPAVAAIAADDYGQLYLLWLRPGPARLLMAKY